MNQVQRIPLLTSLVADFGPSATYTRAGNETYQGADGIWRTNTSANVPSYGAKGIRIQPTRTNFCTNHNLAGSTANMTMSGGVAISTTTDTARLTINGLQTITTSGTVFSILNGSGSTQTLTISGATGSTNAHAFSLFGYANFGSVTAQLTGGLGAVIVPIRDDANPYPRITSENITGCAGTETLEIVLANGAQVRFILNQLEIGADATTAGITDPIVIAGATATRSASTLTTTTAAVNGTNFCVSVDVTPATENQNSAAAYYADVYQSSTHRLRMYGAGVVEKNATTGTVISFGKYAPQLNRTSRLLGKCSLVEGSVKAFSDGAKYNTAGSNGTALTLTGGTIYIGRKQDASQNFNGWIKNFTVISGSPTDSTCATWTEIHEEITPIGIYGTPVHDRTTPSTIWCLGGWNGTNFTKIVTSTDYGNTFTDVVALASPTAQKALQRDAGGNFYYGTTETLRRIPANLASDSVVITWDTAVTTAPTNRTWSWISWTWGESSEGWLYTAAYTLPDVGGQIFYRSTNNGVSWTANTTLVAAYPLLRHMHSVHINNNDNRLYVSVGDDTGTRVNLCSNASVTTWDNVTFTTLSSLTDAKGATGLTFTAEGAYWSSDAVGSQNYITRSSNAAASEVRQYKLPQNMHITPVYFLRAIGANTLVAVAYNETNVTTATGAILILKKLAGSSSAKWSATRINATQDPNSTGIAFYDISHDGRAGIPAAATHFFVGSITYSGQVPNQLYRVSVADKYIEDAEFSGKIPTGRRITGKKITGRTITGRTL